MRSPAGGLLAQGESAGLVGTVHGCWNQAVQPCHERSKHAHACGGGEHATCMRAAPRTVEQHHGPLDLGFRADEQRARLGGHNILCHAVCRWERAAKSLRGLWLRVQRYGVAPCAQPPLAPACGGPRPGAAGSRVRALSRVACLLAGGQRCGCAVGRKTGAEHVGSTKCAANCALRRLHSAVQAVQNDQRKSRRAGLMKNCPLCVTRRLP